MIAKSRTLVTAKRAVAGKIVRLCRCRVCGEAFLIYCRHEPQLEPVWILDDSPHLVDQLAQASPDVLVLDIDVRGGGFDIAAELSQLLEDVRIIFIAKSVSDITIKQALLLGARGIVLTDEPGDALIKHVKRVASGGHSFSDKVAERLRYDSVEAGYRLANGTLFDTLSDLQLEIFRHLARGDSLKMVARKMNLTRKSVDGHKYRIMKKIGVQDRVLLSRLAIREGLIEA
jgi:DNA-binding NarL/FixJ family response regulator